MALHEEVQLLSKPSPLELQESIEMLRAIENNFKVAMVISEFNTKSVDTQEDLDEAISIMNSDQIKNRYILK